MSIELRFSHNFEFGFPRFHCKCCQVWMDIDQMGGSTLESMAKAVEQSRIVLMCMSQKYKNSPNCRAGMIQENTWVPVYR